MANVSLYEVIRKRGMVMGGMGKYRINNRVAMGGITFRIQPTMISCLPTTNYQNAFDTLQKVGVTDARLKLGIKDAREKLVAKCACFCIKGKVQDSREILNSRKQQISVGEKTTKRMDAREKLSLKRSASAVTINSPVAQGSSSSPINITKTIKISQPKTISSGVTNTVKGMQINVVNHEPWKPLISSLQDMDNNGIDDGLELSHIPNKKMKITAVNTVQKRPGMSGNSFSLGQTLPLTKVRRVKGKSLEEIICIFPVPSGISEESPRAQRSLGFGRCS
ncbi:polymerase delta-interacting protein 3-like [Dendrobates tinctorius]|uniref:polymerase delta-interacting protein 3-like n=1 Tax=Dendrobates tinctorius TaxID=92724 RepID=UPI003CC9B037